MLLLGFWDYPWGLYSSWCIMSSSKSSHRRRSRSSISSTPRTPDAANAQPKMSGFFEEKVKGPVVKLLKSGASPASIALAMAFGVSGGIFPVPGLTTVPVMVFIFLFRLNPVAAMLTNYLCTPLNIATVPIFIMYGNTFFGAGEEGAKEFSVAAFTEDLKADPINTLLLFRFTLLHAIYMWLATVPVVTGILYAVLTPILKSVMPKQTTNADEKKLK